MGQKGRRRRREKKNYPDKERVGFLYMRACLAGTQKVAHERNSIFVACMYRRRHPSELTPYFFLPQQCRIIQALCFQALR